MPIKNKSLLLFLFLLVIEFISILYLTLGHRMPLGHDTFYVFGLQYYCLNHTAMYGEIPQWIPYLTHGTSTPWFFIVQGCLTMAINIFSLLGPLLKHMNFLPLFYTGIFVDKVVLLAGVWLLSSRYFSSSLTRFFVASCVMGSCICMTQMGYNMHLYSGIPLTLYLLHMFLDTSRWRYLFLGANLFFVQTIVDCTYFIPVVSLTIFLYFLIDWLHDPSHWIKKIKKLSFGTPAILCAAGILFSALYVAWLLIIAKEPQIISADLGRHANWSTPLNVFLTYGGNTDFRKWLELFCRVSPAMDYTLYMGFIPLALVPIGLFFNPHPRKKQLVLLILVLLLFSMATPLSTFFIMSGRR